MARDRDRFIEYRSWPPIFTSLPRFIFKRWWSISFFERKKKKKRKKDKEATLVVVQFRNKGTNFYFPLQFFTVGSNYGTVSDLQTSSLFEIINRRYLQVAKRSEHDVEIVKFKEILVKIVSIVSRAEEMKFSKFVNISLLKISRKFAFRSCGVNKLNFLNPISSNISFI